MRRATFLLAVAAALAGCSVETEGATCTVAGSTSQCPEGQACGIDFRCSADPQLECPAPGTVVGVDPGNSGTLTGGFTVTPTGADEPPGCRFANLPDALAVATAKAPAAATVRVYKQASPLVVTLNDTLVLPGNVTLTTGDPDAASFLLQAGPSFPTAKDLVRLTPGATLEGFTVTTEVDVTGAAVGTVLPCPAATPSTLRRTKLLASSGGTVHRFERGLLVTGACVVSAEDVEIAGARKDGVLVLPEPAPAALPQVSFTGGLVRDSGATGVRIRGGKLVMSGTEIRGSVVHGVHAEFLDAERAFDVQLSALDVHDNGGTGLFLKDVADAATSTVTCTGSKLRKNAGTAADSTYGGSRKAGGVLLWGNALTTFTFRGNLVCSNGGASADEVAVYSSTTPTWRFGAADDASCSTGGNTFYDAAVGSTGRLVYGTDGNAAPDASRNFWPVDPPASATYQNAVVSPACLPALGATVPTGC